MLAEKPKPTHLSPSSVNMYLEDPARWVLRYGYGIKGRSSAKMLKGIAVEAGVQGYFWPTMHGKVNGERFQFALKLAQNNFMLNIGGRFRDSEDDLIFESLGNCLLMALEGVFSLGMREMPMCQVRLEQAYDHAGGRILPMLGFADFVWQPIVIDLKTTARIPSEPPDNHKRQMAHYKSALRNRPKAVLVYASDKKYSCLEVTDNDAGRAGYALERAARSVSHLIATHSWGDMVSIFYPNFDSYVWCDESREAAEELWR